MTENKLSILQTEIQARLKEKGKTQTELSLYLGLAPNGLTKVFTGERTLKAVEIPKVADFLEWDVTDFARFAAGETSRAPDSVRRDVIKLPYMEVVASAGRGVYAGEEYNRQFMSVSVGKVSSNLPSAKTSQIVAIKGDSMEPTLRDGAFVVIDTAQTELVDGKIFVVCVNDELFIKRLFRDPIKKKVILKSDNPNHPSWEADENDLRICGRLVAKVFEMV